MHVLVVGATGILRPAVPALISRGDSVLAVARDADRLTRLASDYRVDVLACDRLALAAQLRAGCVQVDAALVYAPSLEDPAVPALRRVVRETLVHVITSAVAEPVDRADADWSLERLPGPPLGGVRLVLGWRADGTWHSPAEVSAAAVSCLADAHDALLGRVRPWSGRPR